MQFYTVEQLGPKRSLTPDGFLLCEAVPIARTGVQMYGPGETQITPGGDGMVYIERKEEEVFRPETIASFNGKPVLNDHPQGGAPVDPDTWQSLAVGVVLNPRRGTGVEDNFLIADLLITQREAIDEVMEGKRQVSCGYGAQWVEISAGHGEQRNIVGNHVALVQRARCGSRCSIGDQANEGEPLMWDKLKKAYMAYFKVNTDTALDAAMSTKKVIAEFGADGEVHLHEAPEERSKFTDEALEEKFAAYDRRHAGHDAAIEEIRQKVGAAPHASDAGGEEGEKEIEGELKEEAPPGTGDKAGMAKDSAYLEDSFAATVAAAEILVPGIQLIMFDKARNPKDMFKDMCAFRRRALILASKDEKTAPLMQEVRRGRVVADGEIQKMPCGVVRDFFFSTSALKKRLNNEASRSAAASVYTSVNKGKMKTIADINEANRKKFGGN